MAREPLLDSDPRRVGRYRLSARLGSGGMGVVYLGAAEDGRPVAVKVLRPQLAEDREFRTRFGREVAALVRVEGVCTVRVIEADTTSARPFLVTEYAEGPSLAEYIGARGALAAPMLYGLAIGLAEALTAIHGAGIVHRDLKPSNVLLTGTGPKVIDFGIAQAAGRDLADQAGSDHRLDRVPGARADHGRAERHGGRHLRLGGDDRLRGQRAAPVRHRDPRVHHVPDPARRARPDLGAGRGAPAGRGDPGQGAW